jgi:DNA polymerase-3 subunit delta'
MRFREIIGHGQLLRLLAQAVARDGLPPSLIFSGPDGVGKATTAVALAQALNCERLPQRSAAEAAHGAWDACGECTPCIRLARAAAALRQGDRPAVDALQWLAPDDKDSIKIDPVRQLLSRSAYRPIDGRQRVVIIDHAHALETTAQQALLKMLEEPPSATRFVLVTPQPDLLLPTVRSRCPQLRFSLLTPTEIADALVTRHGWTPSAAASAAAVADGRLGRALGEGVAAREAARDVAADVLEHVAASRSPRERLEGAPLLIARAEAGDRRGESSRTRAVSATRQEISARLDAMSALLRDLSILMSRADRRRLANADLSSRLDQLVGAFPGERLTRAFTVVDQARTAVERNASHKIVADWLVLNL